MNERFTDRARKVMQLANQESQRFNHEYIGTEHILLGLVKQDTGVAAKVLKNLDIDLRKIRLEVENIVQVGPDLDTMGKLPQTPRVKKVIEYSIEEARNLNHNYVGTEHLLLGLLREREGVAAQILMNLGLKLEDVREEVHNLLRADCGTRTGVRTFPEGVQHLPAEFRHALEMLVAEIAQLNRDQESAVAEQDFEKAASLRDRAHNLKKKMAFIQGWPGNYTIAPSWLSWRGGTVAKIAQVINADRHWEDLPILADALEEAGCTNQEILNHCRRPGDHSRSCWVIDLLLGKA
jgi:ATP-dependent Clp protease ATP-binding subunit ClpA